MSRATKTGDRPPDRAFPTIMQAVTVHPESSHLTEERRATLSSTRSLRIVVVDEELPYPPTSGKRIRTLNLLRRLARRHRITLLCHRNADAAEAYHAHAFMQAQGIEIVSVPRIVPPKSGLGFYARLGLNLFSRLPYSVATHTSVALRRALRAYAATHDVDLWHCEWTPYAQALRVLGPVRKLVMAHNVESVIWRRYHETATNPLQRWYIGRQWRKFERFERQAFSEASRTVAVSDTDAALIAREYGGNCVEVVENGVDLTYFRRLELGRNPRQILFLGSLDWRPNLDAVSLLLDRIFPVVRAEDGEARLCLVGRNPPSWLRRRVMDLPGVVLHANVEDVRPYLNLSGILAVPLRIGGGSRLKILEALASGLPVVATKVGAEGLSLEADQHLTVVDSVEDMAAALVRRIRTPQEALAQAERGRKVVVARYDWDALANQLEAVWLRCVAIEQF
jgi:polysaccharide biosynthesis protein PslH